MKGARGARACNPQHFTQLLMEEICTMYSFWLKHVSLLRGPPFSAPSVLERMIEAVFAGFEALFCFAMYGPTACAAHTRAFLAFTTTPYFWQIEKRLINI